MSKSRRTRYTAKQFEIDVAGFNKTLDINSHSHRLVVGGRNGYTALDLARVEQVNRHVDERNLCCGTPRECLEEAKRYMWDYRFSIL